SGGGGASPAWAPGVRRRASTATIRPQSSRLSTLGQTDHDGLPQPATRLLLLGGLRGRPRLRPRPGPCLLTATYSKWRAFVGRQPMPSYPTRGAPCLERGPRADARPPGLFSL